MSKISLRTSSTRLLHQRKKKWSEVDVRLKPFGFCCSMDHFDPLSRYDQRLPPYKSSLTAITSVHECPVSKIQTQFVTPRLSRDKKRLTKSKISEMGDQQPVRNDELSYFRIDRNNRSIKWYLEDEIALARNIFWTEKQRVNNEKKDEIISIGKKQIKKKMDYLLNLCPRWYQDFSSDQMKNLMNLEDVMRTDYKETTTSGTQKSLMAIGVVSTFFKLKSIVIKELHKSCNLNGVNFLRKIYRILTGNDFLEEGYKKFYDCNERIILSAIAFLTLPETVVELHKRLPAIIVPKLPPKPKPPKYLPRRKDSCPYKEELFTRSDWAGYRNKLQKWQKRCKLLAIPKIILPLQKYNQFLNNNDVALEITKQGQNIYPGKKDSTKELEKISATTLNQTSITSIDHQITHKKDFSKREVSEVEKSTIDISQLPDNKTLSVLKPPRASQKSWLGEKDAHYVISGSYGDPTDSVIYEISGVANVTPSNSDERFFAVLKRDKSKKIFPSGRENLSRNWQEWLQNADEEFEQIEDKANELIKSVQSITKLAFPEPVCDSCCLCRQTRKTHEKIRQTKTPYLLIDNVVQNGKKNKYIIGSMHSPGPSPTESPINLLEMIASQDEIKTNIIINDVTTQNGKTQNHISGVEKDKIHIPSRVPDLPALQPVVRNIPPCACAISKAQISKDDHASPSMSKDDISWTKDEGLCPGKKYRPNEPSAYSCKKYPGDKSCRRNPFMKDILKMKKKKEEQGEEAKKEKTEVIDAIKKETQIIRKERKDKFIPDRNYPAYDNPWNISRTAPSTEISEMDYEHTLKLTSPVLPATSTSPKAQKRQKNVSPSNKEIKKFAENTKNKSYVNDKTSGNVSLNVSKRIEEQKKERDTMDKNIKQNKKIPLNKNIADKKNIQFSSTISKSTANNKIKKPQIKLSSRNQIINDNPKKRQSKNVDKAHKYDSIKRDRKNKVDEIEQFDNRKQEMTRLKNMLKSPIGTLGDVQPAVLPEELQATRQPESEEKIDEISDSAISIDEEIRKEPCGWRTKSEQELPAKKTVAYLCEPDYPLETMAIRPGGRSCECRENRSKKKILKYNIGGLMEKDKRGVRRAKLKEENRIIDGVVYFTPPVSPRRSDEYIPEYDLLESPYDMCVGEVMDKKSKLIEKYSGPKSLIERTQKKIKSCNCNSNITKEFVDQKKDIEEIRQKLMELKSPEERWTVALKDAALMDYFTQRKDKTLCWTSCRKFARNAKSRRLKMVKPVCECKNERKIVERNEERSRWKMRQQRLKALKKQAFMHIVDTSTPMVEDTKLIISEVQRIPEEIKHEDNVKYCISGIAKDLSMSPPQQILDGLRMSSPFQTPEPSKEDISSVALHRHWSLMNIPPGPLPKKDTALKEEMNRRKKARDEALMLIYNEEKLMHNVERNQKTWKSHKKVKEKTSEAVELRSPSKKTDNEIEYQQAASREIIVNKIIQDEKHLKEISKIGYRPDISYKQTREQIERTGKKIDEQSHQINDNNDKKHTNSQPNLMTIIKNSCNSKYYNQAELKKMSEEGYMFAKLPKCYLMPQFQDWIMHREGVVFSEIDKQNIMRKTVSTWKLIETVSMQKIESPSLHMTNYQLEKLTYDQAEKIKKEIKKEKDIFYSKIRKARVSYTRTMWNTMEFGKFPCAKFKKAFFTYMANKEADGHVYRPWLAPDV